MFRVHLAIESAVNRIFLKNILQEGGYKTVEFISLRTIDSYIDPPREEPSLFILITDAVLSPEKILLINNTIPVIFITSNDEGATDFNSGFNGLTFSCGLPAAALNFFDPVQLLNNFLAQMPPLINHREHVYIVLKELYTNALEHGILKLNSAKKDTAEGYATYYQEKNQRMQTLVDDFIKINVYCAGDIEKGHLSIEVEDSGEGFDFNSLFDSKTSISELSGRGLPLLNSLCETVEFKGCGNKVVARYSWR